MSKKQKILFVSQYFYPETFRGNDVAFHLAEQGHYVHVVTGIPNYPAGHFFPGYGLFHKRTEVIRGVHVTRLPIVPRGKSSITLLLNYLSFLVIGWLYMLFHAIGHKYDKVFIQQLSPVTMSAPGILYKKLRHVPVYTWVLDLWPESLYVVGGVHNKMVIGFFDHFVRSQYKHSDKILISSRGFAQSILKYGTPEDKLVYFPQWIDDEPSATTNEAEKAPELPSGFKVMFAGAVGESQGFDCIMKAASLTSDHKDIHWVIVGDGRKFQWVKDYISDNSLSDTVHAMGRYPVAMMPQFFSQADVMLVSLTDSPLFNYYLPAKISAYMSASKPIIAALNGEGAETVKDAGCGWHVEPGDAEQLAKLVIQLSQEDKAALAEKGKASRSYYDSHFAKDLCLRQLDDLME